MEDYSLLIDLHRHTQRQGPGGERETSKAIELTGMDLSAPIKLADIGCGTGASTLVLAQSLNAQITAIDFSSDFIEELETKAEYLGLSDRITPLVCSMDNLPFNKGELDVIWAEGSIYNMGFEIGINNWKQFLKPGGLLVVSEITWITSSRPSEIQRHWETEYPEIGTASEKFNALESSGYSPVAYFTLPESCWLDSYYRPLQKRFADFLNRHEGSEEAQALLRVEEEEISLYERYKTYYSYGMYIARKL